MIQAVCLYHVGLKLLAAGTKWGLKNELQKILIENIAVLSVLTPMGTIMSVKLNCIITCSIEMECCNTDCELIQPLLSLNQWILFKQQTKFDAFSLSEANTNATEIFCEFNLKYF